MEDVGLVGVQVSACEGLCSVFWRVARVLEAVVGVFVLARSPRFLRAVAECDSWGVGAGPDGRCDERPLGLVVRVPRHCGVRVAAVKPRSHPCVDLWW